MDAQNKVLFVGLDKALLETFANHEITHDCHVEYCSDSFSALQRLKASSYNLVVMEENIAPLDPFKLMDYVFHELQKVYPMVIVGNGSHEEGTYENYTRVNHPIDGAKLDQLSLSLHHANDTVEEKLFSLDYLNELSNNDQDFLEETIQLFRDTLAVKMNELDKAILMSDFEEVRQIAHNVKPSFAMLGNEKGKSVCQTICYEAKDADIPELSQVVKNEYKLIIKEIEKQFPKLKHYEKEDFDH
ncbi:Hpt domain-containing protein [Flagellimonas amoyensis]|uniref:Hpt domain-containing protein n=1 Tax=Flagellimonas amoyensis TaxID=2169401 RepID=UPI00131EFD26|nr:Hpt domain-containing protein [Allomuricauda amoyensis]